MGNKGLEPDDSQDLLDCAYYHYEQELLRADPDYINWLASIDAMRNHTKETENGDHSD
jgi:hypothetical protein